MSRAKLSVRRGPYRGDVSALCLVVGSHCRGLLLAGTGPSILLFDPTKGRKLCALRVFEGVRVHGVDSGPAYWERATSAKSQEPLDWGESTVVVHGERRVKLVKLSHCDGDVPQLCILSALPRFNYWVVDVKLLLGGTETSIRPSGFDSDNLRLLAIGLSNNSVLIWDLVNSAFIYRLECSERCLLYSMRLWGDSIEALRVAGGTVFNEVLVWKLVSNISGVWVASKSSTNLTSKEDFMLHERAGHDVQNSEATNVKQLPVFEEVVEPVQRLCGHEGSVYRLMWSSDGLSLISASDDRTARVWYAEWRNGRNEGEGDPWSKGVDSGPVLRGHGSRLWDCYVGKKLLATASEDCTCCIWTREGTCTATLKGHRGRGIWRCVYDPDLNILVTGGADSSIKVHSLDKWVTPERSYLKENKISGLSQSGFSQYGFQTFSTSPPWVGVGSGRPSGFIDSKSEYVRCLGLRNPWSLYVCTNQGAIYHVNLARGSEAPWTLITNDLEGPIVCMDLVALRAGKRGDIGRNDDFLDDDILAVGDGRGMVTLMHIQKTAAEWSCLCRRSWTAENKRQLLGVHLFKVVEGMYIFTTDPRGRWRLWQVLDFCVRHGPCNSKSTSICTSNKLDGEKIVVGREDCKGETAQLIAYGCGGSARILCLDMCPYLKFFVCGDKQGDLTVFSVPEDLISARADSNQVNNGAQRGFPLQLPVIAGFKGAHGISAINSVRILPSKHDKGVEIFSTGSDSCICTFTLDQQVKVGSLQDSNRIHCSRVKKVAPSVVENLMYSQGAVPLGENDRHIVTGFSSSDFLLWDVASESEIMRVKCGGWKRPHSTFVGEVPELQHCFAFVRDQFVQVHRNWVSSETRDPCSQSSPQVMSLETSNAHPRNQSLRSQFHGKEISSVVFLRSSRSSEVTHEQTRSIIWMATGSEDETVIISRYLEEMDDDIEQVCTLGDHVGGSAIRALALVSTPYLVNNDRSVSSVAGLTDWKPSTNGHGLDMKGKQELLFSAGAKETLTCWLVDWPQDVSEEMASISLQDGIGQLPSQEDQEGSAEQRDPTPRWLCSYSRQKIIPPAAIASAGGAKAFDRQCLQDEHNKSNNEKSKQGSFQGNGHIDDDQRYLCLTAFATSCVKTGTMISYVATASSNASLHLYACHVTHRSWTELAALEYPNALVLTMEYLAAPLVSFAGLLCNFYMIITGAANGDIVFWDATDVVLEHSATGGAFQSLSNGQPLRPLTGRGSQGGRLRKREEKHEKEHLKRDHAKRTVIEMNIEPALLDSPDVLSTSVDNAASANGVNRERGIAERDHSTDSQVTEQISSNVEVLEERADPKPSLVLRPFEEIKAAHQSGINCLTVAKLQRHRWLADEKKIIYTVISGGDDQALHIAIFTIDWEITDCSRRRSGEGFPDVRGEHALHLTSAEGKTLPGFHILSRSMIQSAHSSAVKGLWTDGEWAFSTGLDQRLRIWRINLDGICTASEPKQHVTDQSGLERTTPLLEEFVTFVIDVPEPASLHASVGPAGRYQIAVVGRGLQVINFDANL